MKKLQARHERACNSFFVHLVFYSSVKSPVHDDEPKLPWLDVNLYLPDVLV